MQAALPSFRRPPVVEMVIGAQMVGAVPHSLQALGKFAAALAAEGLSVQEAMPAVKVRPERADPAETPVGASLDVLLGSGAPPVRHMMRNAAGDEMVQVQTDWIAVNWRKASQDAEYPRWPRRWDTFERRARLAETCFGGGDFRFGGVEVTYLNHIELDDAAALHRHPARALSFLAADDEFTDGFLGPAERCHAGLDFRIGQSGCDTPAGWLSVSASPAWHEKRLHPLLVLTLTARGNPRSPSLEGVREFAHLAREWIVRAFADLTTLEMHAEWEREDGESDKGAAP
ncbi:MAG: hypothetical protein OXG55_15700 [bacterium]|nr:hypothetical protein [bacterium]